MLLKPLEECIVAASFGKIPLNRWSMNGVDITVSVEQLRARLFEFKRFLIQTHTMVA